MTAMGGRPPGNNITRCPYCGGICHTHNTDQVTRTYRKIRYACSNQECGAIFVAELTVLYVLVPSISQSELDPNIPLRLPGQAAERQLDIFKKLEHIKTGESDKC